MQGYAFFLPDHISSVIPQDKTKTAVKSLVTMGNQVTIVNQPTTTHPSSSSF